MKNTALLGLMLILAFVSLSNADDRSEETGQGGIPPKRGGHHGRGGKSKLKLLNVTVDASANDTYSKVDSKQIGFATFKAAKDDGDEKTFTLSTVKEGGAGSTSLQDFKALLGDGSDGTTFGLIGYNCATDTQEGKTCDKVLQIFFYYSANKPEPRAKGPGDVPLPVYVLSVYDAARMSTMPNLYKHKNIKNVFMTPETLTTKVFQQYCDECANTPAINDR